jgi:flagellar hook-associated protein 2
MTVSSTSSASSSLISFSGVGSGLPISQIIEALMTVESQPVERMYTEQSKIQTSKTTLGTLGTKFSSLRSSLEKFTDANLASVFDIFSKRTASSSDSAIASITATNSAAVQNATLKVINLATATTAKSTNKPGQVITGDELVSKLGNSSAIVTTEDDDGNDVGTTFSIYVDNKKYTYNLDETTTLNGAGDPNSIVNQINNNSGGILTASVVDGKFKIDVDNSSSNHDVKLGSSSDTSNFLNIMQLNTKVYEADGVTTDYFVSTNQLSAIDTSGTVVGAGATAKLSGVVTAGDFTIGKATFTIDENTKLSDLIAQINSDEDAGVVAQYDARTNSMKLTSKDPGATYINLSNDNLEGDSANKSNFLAVMGLTVSNEGNPDDNTIASGSQTLGKNATVELNGNTIEATSNTIGSDISGMVGVTIKLNGITPSTTNGTTTVELGVKQDTSSLVDSVNNFVSKFNDLVSSIDTNTSSSGDLKYDYSLIRFKNDVRSSIFNSVSGLSTYNSLATIGISTGAIGTSVDTKTNSLQLDSAKFLEALSKNPAEVKALLIGDKSKGITGVFQTLEAKVESALDPENGYISSRKTAMDAQLTVLQRTIESSEERLKARRETLTKQYNSMDQLISQMKAQNSLSSYGIY